MSGAPELTRALVMVKDAQDDEFDALLGTYWPDVDVAWDRAVRWRRGHLSPGRRLPLRARQPPRDPFGNQWMVSARIETVTSADLAAREPA
jgi:hypothetical protein